MAEFHWYSTPYPMRETTKKHSSWGVIATKDKATVVRYRACMLLAYSLNSEALPHLRAQLSHSDKKTVDDAKAAIDAIECKNHNYFVDRQHSGKMFWTVGGNAA